MAQEVKELARQSGDNADTISRTLTDVRTEVDAAVAKVAEIATSMAELSNHNGALTGAIEQQSATSDVTDHERDIDAAKNPNWEKTRTPVRPGIEPGRNRPWGQRTAAFADPSGHVR